MHRIEDAIVQGGKLVLSDLPFREGQHVHVIVAEATVATEKPLSIHEVRRLLKGCVERFENPFEPMIPESHWEMLG
jgi:hypothetical protein